MHGSGLRTWPGLWVCLVLMLGGLRMDALAETRPRTPAEIEIRRSEVAGRVSELDDEEAHLVVTVDESAGEERARAVARLAALGAEREALASEAEELARVVTRTPTGPVGPADPVGLAAAQLTGSTQQVTSGTDFNPAITVIPDGLYYYDTRDGRVAEWLAATRGFEAPASGDAAEGLPRGFSLREVELTFSGAIDPYFDVWATFGIGDGEIEAEEVYVQTRRLLPGLQARFGRFFSGIGYLNRQHRHQWDFVDAPLPYELLFGANLADVGVQVTWLPELPVYVQLGFEALQGDSPALANQLVDAYPERLGETPGPRLFTSFVKVAPDLGYAHTLQLGASAGRSRSHQDMELDPTAGQLDALLDGTTWFVGGDVVWRRDSPRAFGQGDLTVQGEYFYRARDLDLVSVTEWGERRDRQDGLYGQVVYGIAPRWTAGGRLEAAGLRNERQWSGGRVEGEVSRRFGANVTFDPTEFSRLRVQYNRGRLWVGGEESFHQVFVQLQMSLGVHGSHPF